MLREMDTVNIELRVLFKFREKEDAFKTHLYDNIDTFRAKYEEIFGHPIPFNNIKVVNRFLRGYAIQSIESTDHDSPDEGSEGLEIEYSDYRDVYDLTDIPEWPFRHVDTIYRYSNRERFIEYNIKGSVIIEIEWNADNEPRLVQENDVDCKYVPLTFEQRKI
jgi:hypothetical protein